jgi:hypothetical protein
LPPSPDAYRVEISERLAQSRDTLHRAHRMNPDKKSERPNVR